MFRQVKAALKHEWPNDANNGLHLASDGDSGAVFEDGMSDFVSRSESCSFHGHQSDSAAVKRAFQFSVKLENGQFWAFRENVGFSRTCRTGEALEYIDAKLARKKISQRCSLTWCNAIMPVIHIHDFIQIKNAVQFFPSDSTR